MFASSSPSDALRLFLEQQDLGKAHSAAEGLIGNVENAIDHIERNAELIAEAIESNADAVRELILAKTDQTVAEIKKETTLVAASLLRNAGEKSDEKSRAKAAGELLEEASILSKNINRQAEESLASIARELAGAEVGINRVREQSVRDLTTLGNQGIQELAKIVKATPRTNENRTAEPRPPEKDGVGVDEIVFLTEKALVELQTRIQRTVEDASSKLNAARDTAAKLLKQTAREAVASIENAIANANKRIVSVTETAIVNAVPTEEIDHFNLGSLRQRWIMKRH